jgi:hypothetical protein
MPLVRIQIRRDTAANWTASNPVLAAGEPAVETDTGKTKTGDGIRNWTTLPYDIEPFLSGSTPAAVGTAASGTALTAARADHVHAMPTALSVATLATSGNATIGGNLSVTGTLTAASQSISAGNIPDLGDAIDDRVATLLVQGTGISLTYVEFANKLTVAVGSHNQAISTITGLQAELDGKPAIVHGHAIIDVTGLGDALAIRPTSDVTSVPNSTAITNIVSLSQTAYDALTTKNATTLYVIT